MDERPEAGTLLGGRYRLEEPLGRGGMAEVWRARHLALNAWVAVKVLRAAHGQDDEVRRRFLAEAQITVKLKSRFAVQVFDFGVSQDGLPYLVMELLDGETLAERLARDGKLSARTLVTFMSQAARALDRAHALGIVHRDLKPENLFVVKDDDGVEYLKVTDFGIARIVGELERSPSPALPPPTDEAPPRLTRTGTRLGTPYYMAPEQVEAAADRIGPATDVWALGVVSYECLTGARPFDGADANALFEAILRESPRPLRTLDRALPEAVDAWFLRACARPPAERFASAMVAVQALAEALGVPELARRGEPPADAEAASSSAPAPRGENDARGEPLADTALEHTRSNAPAQSAGAGATRSRAMSRAGIAAGALAFVGAAAVVSVAGAKAWRHRASSPAAEVASAAPSPLAPPASTLACPILDAHGSVGPPGWFGAAAAAFACARARVYLGGREARVMVPAELLDLPAGVTSDFPHDPFSDGDARGKTLDAAKQRATAMLDGTVAIDHGGITVTLWLALARPDGADAKPSRGHGQARTLGLAVSAALDQLVAAGALPRADRLDPEAARWLGGADDLDTALAVEGLEVDSDSTRACALLEERQATLGAFAHVIAGQCSDSLHPWQPPLPKLVDVDRSSPAALAWSVYAMNLEENLPDARALAAELSQMGAAAQGPIDQAYLALAEGHAWMYAQDDDRARAALTRGVSLDPHDPLLWEALGSSLWGTTSGGVAYAAAGAWVPYSAWFLPDLASESVAVLPQHLRATERAHALDATPSNAALYGRALSDSGRPEDALALATETGPDTDAGRALLARLDERSARFAAALDRLRPLHGDALIDVIGQSDELALAELLGRRREVGTEQARRILEDLGRHHLEINDGEDVLEIGLCMYAERSVALACLDGLAAEMAAKKQVWGEGEGALLAGGRRYVLGDMKGAVAAWRPLVALKMAYFARVLPTEAFVAADEEELAEKLDEKKDRSRFLAGESVALPRQALRAEKRGDIAAAQDMARRAIEAWGTADADIPALAEMRRLARGKPPR